MDTTYVAFDEMTAVADGTLEVVATRCFEHVQTLPSADRGRPILIFDTATGRQLDLDLSGSIDDVRARYRTNAEPPVEKRRRGRPKLGVVGREVTLLPRHWAWLDAQPGGPSPTLRRLIDRARRADGDPVKNAQHRAHGFMTAIAGNLPGFEEAIRALYAPSRDRFLAEIDAWPEDVRKTAITFAADAFGASGTD